MENVSNKTVCFFDSGIGGLHLLLECVRRLPSVDFTYFADNYNVPYGSFSKEKLMELALKFFDAIAKLHPDAAVIACNTVTTHCIEALRAKYTFEIIGVEPAIKPAASIGGKCVVLATPATAASVSMRKLIENYGNKNTEVYGCEHLAEYIENNIGNLSAEKVRGMLPAVRCDSIVLGCTHYIYIKDMVKATYNCPVFDGIEGTAANLCKKIGISDHHGERGQKLIFSGGNEAKNRDIFRLLLKVGGTNSLNY